MQKLISNIFKYDTHVSFEVFPPKTALGLKQIYQTICKLKDLNPDFFSVTYGAGGSTAEKSLEIASAITNLANTTCVAHFTCVGMNKSEIKALLDSLKNQGVSNVLALRGDPPKGDVGFNQVEDGFAYASDLVRFIKENSDVGILVAGYPEGHTENPCKEDDFQRLLDKIQAGADGIVTQLFYDNRFMLDFKQKLEDAKVEIPLIPGIFPISNAKQIVRITELSGASLPDDLKKALEKYQDSPEDMEKFGTDFAVRQVQDLLDHGFNAFHFYTMNRHRQIRNILFQLREYFPRLNF